MIDTWQVDAWIDITVAWFESEYIFMRLISTLLPKFRSHLYNTQTLSLRVSVQHLAFRYISLFASQSLTYITKFKTFFQDEKRRRNNSDSTVFVELYFDTFIQSTLLWSVNWYFHFLFFSKNKISSIALYWRHCWSTATTIAKGAQWKALHVNLWYWTHKVLEVF